MILGDSDHNGRVISIAFLDCIRASLATIYQIASYMQALRNKVVI
jgi:hypothetical protein